VSERSELYRRLNEQAAKEVASWPEWKRDGIVSYPRRRSEAVHARQRDESIERSKRDGEAPK
jgi:hypothetical protein